MTTFIFSKSWSSKKAILIAFEDNYNLKLWIMDFRLKVFAVTSETLNFTKAAEILKISQPAVTKHIQELEKEYGIQLFARHGTKLELTYQGEYFLARAKEILIKYRELESETSMLKTVFSGSIKIGAPAALYYGVIPRLAADFSMLSPGVKMDLKITESGNIRNEIKSGKIDVGFSYNSKSAKHFFIRDSLVLVSDSQIDALKDEASECEGIKLAADKLNLISYRGDAETEVQLKCLFSACGFNYSKANVIAELENAKSAIDFLINCKKAGVGKNATTCTFLWRSQISEYLRLGLLHASDCQWLNDSDVSKERMPGVSAERISGVSAERIYGIEGASSPKNNRFIEYASKWGERVFGSESK